MPVKKAVAAGNGTALAREAKPATVRAPEHEWSQQDIDQQWERIRVRGEQISADIAALRARISSN